MAMDGVGEGDPDTVRMLIATDTHLGYNEKDNLRGNDSFNTWEEILQIAQKERCDFILHGGDLFHDNKPSRSCLYKTMDLLRRYTLGPGAIEFQVVSDPAVFARGMVNCEDPNVNVERPLFMIHGNHDDPGGESNLSAANILEMASLVNYFGRADNLEEVVVRPVLIRKGGTQIAIYGLGNIRDERLNRMFVQEKIRFETPADVKEWFNVMLIHQNRHKGNKAGVPTKSCIHEQMLPDFFDLVIWGHEHDSQIVPKESLSGEYYIIQPGSSVATSLTPGEAEMKSVAVVELRMGQFRVIPQQLCTVRPLAFNSEYSLAESGIVRTDTQSIWQALAAEVDVLIERGSEEIRNRKRQLEARGYHRNLQVPDVPLVRLRVEHSGFEPINSQQFGQSYADKLANPEDIFLWHKRKGGDVGGAATSGRGKVVIGDMLEIEEAQGADGDEKIQDIIYKYIEGDSNLQILSEPDLNDAVQSFVHRMEPCAIESFVKGSVEATNVAVLRESHAVAQEEIRVQIQDRAENMRQRRLAGVDSGAAAAAAPGVAGADSAAFFGGADTPVAAPAVAGPGWPPPAGLVPGAPLAAPFPAHPGAADAGRGRGRGGRGRARGRGANAKRGQDAVDEFAFAEPAAKVARGGRARASGAGGSAAAAAAVASGTSLREQLLMMERNSAGEAAGGASQSLGLGAPAGDTPGLAGATPFPVATPFLGRKRGVATAGEAVGDTGLPPAGAMDGAASSLRFSQPTTARRQWALRGQAPDV